MVSGGPLPEPGEQPAAQARLGPVLGATAPRITGVEVAHRYLPWRPWPRSGARSR